MAITSNLLAMEMREIFCLFITTSLEIRQTEAWIIEKERRLQDNKKSSIPEVYPHSVRNYVAALKEDLRVLRSREVDLLETISHKCLLQLFKTSQETTNQN